MANLVGSRAVAHALNYMPNAVRAWRTAGNLDGIGRLRGRDMTYDRDDIALLATAVCLIAQGWRNESAFGLVRSVRSEIIAALAPASNGTVTISSDTNNLVVTVNVRDLTESACAKAHDFERRRAA